MKILLISENRCLESIIPYPLGIACVAAAAVRAGHEVSGLDLMFSEDPVADVINKVRSFKPHCVGLSIRNIDNQDMVNTEFYLPPLKRIVEALKSETEAPVILGGAGFTMFPLQCLEYLGLEIGVMGEGEVTLVELLERLEAGFAGADPAVADDPAGSRFLSLAEDIPGLALRQGGKAWVNPPRPLAEPGMFPPPDRDIFDVTRYDWSPGKTPAYAANLQARRGCPMHCIYCSTPRVEGRIMRTRPAAQVAEELESLESDYGIKTAFFVDSLFDYPPDYTRELCREIGQRGLSLRWYCSLNPLYADRELMTLLRQAGCVGISIGNESGSEDILESLKKGFSKKDVERAVRGAQSMGFHLNCFLLLGGPGENESTVKESVEFMSELSPDVVRVTVGIRIYPGCELEEIALREGMISPGLNLLTPAFYLSRDVREWLYDYMVKICSSRRGWFIT